MALGSRSFGRPVIASVASSFQFLPSHLGGRGRANCLIGLFLSLPLEELRMNALPLRNSLLTSNTYTIHSAMCLSTAVPLKTQRPVAGAPFLARFTLVDAHTLSNHQSQHHWLGKGEMPFPSKNGQTNWQSHWKNTVWQLILVKQTYPRMTQAGSPFYGHCSSLIFICKLNRSPISLNLSKMNALCLVRSGVSVWCLCGCTVARISLALFHSATWLIALTSTRVSLAGNLITL